MEFAAPIKFDLAPQSAYTEGEFRVYPNSLLFRAGHYPDKNLSVSPAELAAAVDGFAPIEFNLEHDTDGAKGAAVGLCGHIRRAWVDPADPATVRGDAVIPTRLDDKLLKRGVSMEIGRASKTFCGAAITYTPRVSDAALMSEIAALDPNVPFDRHDTPEGQRAIQAVHDMTTQSGGAVCKKGNTADMASRHEASAMQQTHDLMCLHGATCADMKGYATPYVPRAIYSTDVRNSGSRQPDRPARKTTTGETKPMSLKDKLRAGFVALGLAEDKIPDITDDDIAQFAGQGKPTVPAPDSQVAAMSARLKAQEEQFAALKREGVEKDAATFARELRAAGRVFPPQESALAALLAQAVLDDARDAQTVTFTGADDTPVEGSRADALKAFLAAAPATNLGRELVLGATYLSLHAAPPPTKKDALDALDAETRAWAEKTNKTGGK